MPITIMCANGHFTTVRDDCSGQQIQCGTCGVKVRVPVIKVPPAKSPPRAPASPGKSSVIRSANSSVTSYETPTAKPKVATSRSEPKPAKRPPRETPPSKPIPPPEVAPSPVPPPTLSDPVDWLKEEPKFESLQPKEVVDAWLESAAAIDAARPKTPPPPEANLTPPRVEEPVPPAEPSEWDALMDVLPAEPTTSSPAREVVEVVEVIDEPTELPGETVRDRRKHTKTERNRALAITSLGLALQIGRMAASGLAMALGYLGLVYQPAFYPYVSLLMLSGFLGFISVGCCLIGSFRTGGWLFLVLEILASLAIAPALMLGAYRTPPIIAIVGYGAGIFCWIMHMMYLLRLAHFLGDRRDVSSVQEVLVIGLKMFAAIFLMAVVIITIAFVPAWSQHWFARAFGIPALIITLLYEVYYFINYVMLMMELRWTIAAKGVGMGDMLAPMATASEGGRRMRKKVPESAIPPPLLWAGVGVLALLGLVASWWLLGRLLGPPQDFTDDMNRRFEDLERRLNTPTADRDRRPDPPRPDPPPEIPPGRVQRVEPPPATVLPGLIGYWCFDEDDDDEVADLGPHRLHGTLHGGIRIAGIRRNAIRLNGRRDYFDYGESAKLNFAAKQPFTIALWIRTREFGGVILSQRDMTSGGPVIDVGIFGQSLQITVRGDGKETVRSVDVHLRTKVTDGEWHHIALMRGDDKGIECYINGVLQERAEGETTDQAITTNSRRLGTEQYWIEKQRRHPEGVHYKGDIDEFCIFDRRLKLEDLRKLAGWKQGD